MTSLLPYTEDLFPRPAVTYGDIVPTSGPPTRVLVACEYSGTRHMAMRPAAIAGPATRHIRGDARAILNANTGPLRRSLSSPRQSQPVHCPSQCGSSAEEQ